MDRVLQAVVARAYWFTHHRQQSRGMPRRYTRIVGGIIHSTALLRHNAHRLRYGRAAGLSCKVLILHRVMPVHFVTKLRHTREKYAKFRQKFPRIGSTMAERKRIPSDTKLRLFSEAAGHCQCPDCLCHLFPAEMGGDKHIAEMAHVIPHGNEGPRYRERPAGIFEADSFENLILLCPKCHTVVDKNPDGYSRGTLLDWKRNHLATLAHRQGIRAYEKRGQARQALQAPMAENKSIWNKFAPADGSCFEYNPESEAAKTWEQRVRGVIIPNHYRIQAIVKANLHHMTEAERQTFAQYQEHVRGLSERHVCGVAGSAIRYPAAMDGVFE